MGDVNSDGHPDLVVTDGFSDTVSVLLGNGDGTFQAPREFAVGAFVPGSSTGLLLSLFRRDVVLADFNQDGHLDIAVTNKDSGDISVLLGNGDGTFAPQRRFDATSVPFGIDAGDLNGDSIPDLAVIDATNDMVNIAVLIGRGDGTFRHEQLIHTGFDSDAFNGIKIADINGDGHADILVNASKDEKTHVLLGAGDGITFKDRANFDGGGPAIDVGDLNGDGIPDVVTTSFYLDSAQYILGTGNGKFEAPVEFDAGTAPVSVRIADMASIDADGNVVVGEPDGFPDIISAGSGAELTSFQGSADVLISAGLGKPDGDGNLFAAAVPLASAQSPLSLAVGDINGDGSPELAFVDTGGVQVLFTKSPDFNDNSELSKARDLGVVVHAVEPTFTILPDHPDAFYSMKVPTEATGRGDEVIDFAGNFEHESGGGLQMEVLDSTGSVLARGEHARLSAPQGSRLLVHIFGASADVSAGAYTLDISVLPQLVSVQGQSLFAATNGAPGGATASLVLGFQGERLNVKAAENPKNYVVTWLGPDGISDTADDQVIPIAASGASGIAEAKPVVYDASANIDVVSGLTYPTAVHQTVTLLFKNPLPAGAYRVQVRPAVGATPFNESEPIAGHPVVTLTRTGIARGADLIVGQAVAGTNAKLDLSTFMNGNPFLSQLQADLGALLDQHLSEKHGVSGTKAITGELIAQLAARLGVDLPSPLAHTSLLALFLDPVSLDLQDPAGQHVNYNLTTGDFSNAIPNAYVSVSSNVELVVIPLVSGRYNLDVSDVPDTARGGAIVLRDGQQDPLAFTDDLQNRITTFPIDTGGNTSPGGDSPVSQTQTDTPAAPEVQPISFGTPVRSADYGSFTSRATQRVVRTSATTVRHTSLTRGWFLKRSISLDLAGAIWKLLSTANELLQAPLEPSKPAKHEKAREPVKQDHVAVPDAPTQTAPPEPQKRVAAPQPRSTVETLVRPAAIRATIPPADTVQQRRRAAIFCVAAISMLSCASANLAKRSRKRCAHG